MRAKSWCELGNKNPESLKGQARLRKQEANLANFLVTYDLIERKDYKRLTDELKRLGAHKALLSVWLLQAGNTATEVCNHLADFIDSDDKLMVVEFSKKPRFTQAFEGTNAWISEHV